eukprot:Skav231597  [mRNA]  locus=scaffold232:315466:322306:+ [translate_table: standard]
MDEAFRLLDFGCQLAQHQRIVDLAAANGIFDHVKRIWQQLQIQTGEWDVIEAVLGRHFENMRKRFQLSMESARQRAGEAVTDEVLLEEAGMEDVGDAEA